MEKDFCQEILEKWSICKEKMSILEERIAKYKKMVEREMRKQQSNTIQAGDFSVTKRSITKTTISQKNVPKEIWDRYSTRSTFDSYYLTKTKPKKKKKLEK